MVTISTDVFVNDQEIDILVAIVTYFTIKHYNGVCNITRKEWEKYVGGESKRSIQIENSSEGFFITTSSKNGTIQN